MLTRSQVAKRLGKSIATVRRLEGDRLHPRRDEAGVYRFREEEVKRLATNLVTQRARRDSPLFNRGARSTPRTCVEVDTLDACDDLAASPSGTHSKEPLADPDRLELRGGYQSVQELESELSRRKAQSRVIPDDECACLDEVREIIAIANGLSDRDLRRLGHEGQAILDVLIYITSAKS